MLNCLSDLEKYIHSRSNMPPLIRIGLVHYQFEAIHPFLDGNGRVGRLLIKFTPVSLGLTSPALAVLKCLF